jgi:hypothetical protein
VTIALKNRFGDFMKSIFVLVVLISIGSYAQAQSIDPGQICYTTKENVYTPAGYEIIGARHYGIYISKSISEPKGVLYRYVDKKDYSSEEAAEKAAIGVAEQLDEMGVCRYLRGWLPK